MHENISKTHKLKISKAAGTAIIFTCLSCILLFSLARLLLFGPTENKLPITESTDLSSSLSMNMIYQSNKNVPYAAAIVAEGTRAYLLAEDRESIYMLDISDPEFPLVDKIYSPLDFYARDIIIHGNYLYVDTGALEILDVTDTNNPKTVWQFDTKGLIINIAFSSAYMYVTDSESNLYIINNTDPNHPKLVEQLLKFSDLDYIEYATTSGDLLFIASNGLYVFNISDPTTPIEIGFYGLPFGVEHFDRIVVSNKTVWVRGKYSDLWGDPQSHILLLDISNPSKPNLISTYDHYPFTGISDILCFYDASTNNESIHLMDFSVPEKPVELGYLVGAYSSLGYPSVLITKDRDVYIYSGNFHGGINIIKYSPP